MATKALLLGLLALLAGTFLAVQRLVQRGRALFFLSSHRLHLHLVSFLPTVSLFVRALKMVTQRRVSFFFSCSFRSIFSLRARARRPFCPPPCSSSPRKTAPPRSTTSCDIRLFCAPWRDAVSQAPHQDEPRDRSKSSRTCSRSCRSKTKRERKRAQTSDQR